MEKIIKKLLGGYYSLEQLGIESKDIAALKEAGHHITSYKRSGTVFYTIPDQTENVSVLMSGAAKTPTRVRWVELSDLHAGSDQFDARGLRDLLVQAKDAGYKTAHLSGDQCDGYRVYPGHLANLKYWRAEDQARCLAEILSDFQMDYIAISGNHCASFEAHGSPNPNALVAQMLPNYTYLPTMSADLVISGVVKRMVHLAGGSAYALSYPGQTYIRNVLNSAGEHVYVKGKKYRLRFIQFGHLHSSVLYEAAGIVASHPGNTQFPTDFSARRGLVGPQGCRFVDVVIHNGQVLEYTSKFVKPRR